MWAATEVENCRDAVPRHRSPAPAAGWRARDSECQWNELSADGQVEARDAARVLRSRGSYAQFVMDTQRMATRWPSSLQPPQRCPLQHASEQ